MLLQVVGYMTSVCDLLITTLPSTCSPCPLQIEHSLVCRPWQIGPQTCRVPANGGRISRAALSSSPETSLFQMRALTVGRALQHIRRMRTNQRMPSSSGILTSKAAGELLHPDPAFWCQQIASWQPLKDHDVGILTNALVHTGCQC